MKAAILLALTDPTLCQRVKDVVLSHGYEALESTGLPADRPSLRRSRVDLVIVGSSPRAPMEAVAATHRIRHDDARIPIILVTPSSSEELAIAALRAGVTDYFAYPFQPDEFMAAIRRCLLQAPLETLPVAPEAAMDGADCPSMIGTSAAIREIRAYIERLGATSVNVLISGETGTGKELAAELIHRSSPRYRKPFVGINCAAIPDSLVESELFGHERGAFTGAHALHEGKLKLADGGTAFFDEVGDMSPEGQAKILRVIESKEVHRLGGKGRIALDVRVIAATNQDLEERVAEGTFRKDLYFRLNVARIHLPPLRDRKEDIQPLIDHYIPHLNRRFGREVEGVTDEALEYLLRYDWPGNVRELKNLGEAIFINQVAQRITVDDLPDRFRQRVRGARAPRLDERDSLLSTLASTNWNKSKAAQKLNWSRMTLYRKLAKYRLGGSRTDG